MTRKVVLALLITTFLSLLVCVKPNITVDVKASNGYPVHNLNSGLNYTTIQGAIHAPETFDGHTIFVEKGIYIERLYINKSLALIGEDKSNTIVDGGGYGNIVYIMASKVNVTGFAFQNPAPKYSICIAVIGTPSLIRSCMISDNRITSSNETYGIFIQDAPLTTVSYNIITNSCCGVFIGSPRDNNNTINGNIIANNTNGITFQSGYSSLVTDNLITENKVGIHLKPSCNLTLGNVIRSNMISNNQYGIYVDHSTNNSIYHNNFVDNTEQVYDYWWNYSETWPPRSINIWDNSYPSGGNYWNDYNGSDLYYGPYQNETGYDWIGDSPYVIDQNNIDKYPLIHPFVPEVEEIRIAYRNLLVKYGELQEQIGLLNSTYRNLQESTSNLTSTFNSTLDDLRGQINSLNQICISLDQSIIDLQERLGLVNETLITLDNKINNIQNALYILAAPIVVLIVAIIYVATRKPKTSKQQAT